MYAMIRLVAAYETLLAQEKEAFPIEKFDRVGLEGLIKRRFFYGPSASLYGGRFI